MTQKTLDVTITSRVMRQSTMFLHALAMAYAGKDVVVVCATADDARQSLELFTRLFYKHEWTQIRLDEKTADSLIFSSGGKVSIYVPRVRPEPDPPLVFIDEFQALTDYDVQKLIDMGVSEAAANGDPEVYRVWRNGNE